MAAAEAGEGYIGYYDGGAFGIPHSSKNKEAALLWLQYIGQPSVQADWAVAGARIVQTATYDDPKVQEQDAKVDGYYTLMREQGPAVRRRAALPVPQPGARGGRAVHLPGDHRRADARRTRSTRRPPRPRPS